MAIRHTISTVSFQFESLWFRISHDEGPRWHSKTRRRLIEEWLFEYLQQADRSKIEAAAEKSNWPLVSDN